MGPQSRTPRPTFPQIWLRLAGLVSERSTCPRGHNGAVLVNLANQVISTGYNGSARGQPHCDDVGCLRGADGGCLRTVHAEANAVLQAGRQALASVLYCTTSPCLACAKLIINARVRTVVFASVYRDPSGVVLLADGGVQCVHMNHDGRELPTVDELLAGKDDQ